MSFSYQTVEMGESEACSRKTFGEQQEVDAIRQDAAYTASCSDVGQATLQECTSLDMSSGIVALNIGGKRFLTSWSTLLEEDSYFYKLPSDKKDSYFYELLRDKDEDWAMYDSEGAIFIDRDPDLFREILFFLRTGLVDEEYIDGTENKFRTSIERLFDETKFYRIPSLLAELSQHIVMGGSYGGTFSCSYLNKWKTIPPDFGDGPIRFLKIDGLWIMIVYTYKFNLYHIVHGLRWSSAMLCDEIRFIATQLTPGPKNLAKRIAVASHYRVFVWDLPSDVLEGDSCVPTSTPLASSLHSNISTLDFIGNTLALSQSIGSPRACLLKCCVLPSERWHVAFHGWFVTALMVSMGGAMLAAESHIISRIKPRARKAIFVDPSGYIVTTMACLKKSLYTFEIAYGTAEGVVRLISNGVSGFSMLKWFNHRSVTTTSFRYTLRETFPENTKAITNIFFSSEHMLATCSGVVQNTSSYIYHVTSKKRRGKTHTPFIPVMIAKEERDRSPYAETKASKKV